MSSSSFRPAGIAPRLRPSAPVFLALLWATTSCQSPPAGEETDPPEGAIQYRHAWPAPDPPRAPERFDLLGPEPIEEAVGIVSSLGSADLELDGRRRLVELYRAAGFHGAALFFENTVRIAEGAVIEPRPIDSPIAWTAWADVELERPRKVAEETYRLTLDGQYLEAIRLAREDLEGHGSTNQVAVQWADAVLWAVAGAPHGVSAGEIEAALRLFLTAIEEYGGAYPVSHWGRPYAHSWLAAVFTELDDRLSAFTAISLALIESAELPRDHLARLPDFTREDRCRDLPVLQRELGLSDSWWPAERSFETVCAGG